MRLFCERCTCEDPAYFVKQAKRWVCRRCIQFSGQEGQSLHYDGSIEISLPFTLTPHQQALSHQIADLSQVSDVLVHAVCGAGKTELMLETIETCIQQGKKVVLAVARRQVVLQLHQRLQANFPNLVVRALCEGYTQHLEGHLIVCTTHQLYRFYKQLDILILDEPDAYPFSKEPVLQGFAKQACVGHTIYLSATPSQALLDEVKHHRMIKLDLMRRPHGYDLPIPSVLMLPKFAQVIYLHHWIDKQTKPVLIFVPSINLGKRLSFLLRYPFAYSTHTELDQLIHDFQNHTTKVLLCTTVLERGVTFEDIQVCVLYADHRIFEEATLTQIAGRVGRSMQAPTGEVLFLCSKITSSIQACLHAINSANRSV